MDSIEASESVCLGYAVVVIGFTIIFFAMIFYQTFCVDTEIECKSTVVNIREN